jgi:amino acid adenylation domain-containing protein
MSDLAARIASLPPEKRALLVHRLMDREGRTEPPPLRPRQRTPGGDPLSPAQERVWIEQARDPASAFYSEAMAFRLGGPLRAPLLEQALRQVVRRHEILRTVFANADGELVQRVGDDAGRGFACADLRALSAAAREAEAMRLAHEQAQRPFDLERGPLFRLSLLRLDEDEHLLVFTVHHIVFDGWSTGVFFDELFTLYHDIAAGQPPSLPAPACQYADFAAWQREELAGAETRRQLAYWTERLAGMTGALPLPADHPRPAVPGRRGGRASFTVPPALAAELRALGRQEGCTLFMVLLAAFTLLLHRYSRQGEIAVGMPVTVRRRRELERLIGLFTNTVVLRTPVAGARSFRQLLARVRGTVVGAQANQEVPFERVVQALRPERDPGHTPFFQVMFDLKKIPLFPVERLGLTLEPLELHTGTAKFDWALSMWEAPVGLVGNLEYSTELFDPPTIERAVEHYQRLLAAVAADPAGPLAERSLLSAAERQQLLEASIAPAADPLGETRIHRVIAAEAARRREADAVLCGEQRLSYAELDTRANRLAHHLRARGVGPEVRVASCLEPSTERVIAFLAVLRAGGALLPLDPGHPADRLAFMLEDAGATVLLTHSSIFPRLPATSAQVVCLDGVDQEIAALPATPPDERATADSIAYIIYTSGSTGRPKGVQVPHRGLANVAAAQRRLLGVGPDDRVLQFSSPSFDASIFEMVMALAAGATLCLGRRDQLLPGEPLERFLRERAISVVTLPPAALAFPPAGELPALRLVTVAGDVCPADAVERWGRGRRFLNLYGPTESTIWATAEECAAGAAPPPIGRPIPGTRAYVVDAELQLVPAGVPGELCLGGAGMARGYLGMPNLTAERFVPDPFAAEPGARLYRTGDLARWLERAEANGAAANLRTDALTHSRTPALEFLGRLDHQVKVRGFRVELGEVEAVLRAQPGVEECVVVPLGEGAAGRAAERRLVAYLVAPAGLLAEADLRERLRRRLPEYMVPSAFVALPALPTTPSGKVDRAALPAPAAADAPVGVDGAEPRTETERAVAAVWAELLGREPAGAHDNFFDLGGHSLLVARLVARLRDALEMDVPVATAFERPTVAGLAAWIDGTRRGEGSAALPACVVPFRAQGARSPLFLVPPISGSPLCYLDLARNLGAEQPVYGFLSPGLAGEGARCDTMAELADVYLAAMRQVQPAGPYLLGGWSLGAPVAFEMARRLEADGEQVAMLALLDAGLPGDDWRLRRLFGFGLWLLRVFLAARLFTSWTGIRRMGQWVGLSLPETLEEVRGGTARERLAFLRRVVADCARAARVAGANLRAVRRYAPAPYGGRVTLFRAAERTGAGDAVLDRLRTVAPAGVDVVAAPGNHMTLVLDEAVAADFAAQLGRRLREAQAGA